MFSFDVITTVGAFYIAFTLRFNQLPKQVSIELIALVCSVLIVLFLSGTYSGRQSMWLPSLPRTTFFKTLLAIVPCSMIVYIFGPNEFTQFFGRGVLPAGIVLAGIFATFNRFIINLLYSIQEKRDNILFIGGDSFAEEFKRNLIEQSDARQVTYTKSIDIGKAKGWSEIVLSPDYYPTKKDTSRLVNLRLLGTEVRSFTAFWEHYWFKIPISSVKDDWFYFSQGFSVLSSSISQRVKRAVDILCALLLLALCLPIIVIAALLVAISSKGAAFFCQQRLGLNGKEFTIYKLRTMSVDAEASGAQWATINDTRITKVGRFLRLSRLDELPQLWNVLKGDMSLVGPRPERPEFTGQLSKVIPYYDLRHLVKPGLTGWAQVMYPYGASEEDSLRKLEYDLYYIKHQSFFFDFNILARTVAIVTQNSGR